MRFIAIIIAALSIAACSESSLPTSAKATPESVASAYAATLASNDASAAKQLVVKGSQADEAWASRANFDSKKQNVTFTTTPCKPKTLPDKKDFIFCDGVLLSNGTPYAVLITYLTNETGSYKVFQYLIGRVPGQ